MIHSADDLDALIAAHERAPSTFAHAIDLAAALAESIRLAPILTYEPFDKQLAFHQDTRKIVVYSGSNRGGKSFAAIREIVWCIKRTHPWKRQHKPPFSIYLVGSKYPKLEEVILPQIRAHFPKGCNVPYWEDKEQHIFHFYTNEGEVTLVVISNEARISSAAGGDPVLVVEDEEPSWELHQECLVRLISRRGQLLLCATSVPEDGKESNVWMYQKLLKNIPDLLSANDAATAPRPFTGGSDPDIGAYIVAMHENPYNSADYIEFFKKHLDEGEIQSRVYGDPTPVARRPVFSPAQLMMIQSRLKAPIWRGEIHYDPTDAQDAFDPEIFESKHGQLAVWKWPDENAKYIIGGDTSEGKGDEGDWSVWSILDWEELEEVAQYRSRSVDPGTFADIGAALGYLYNCAVIAPEVAKEGYVVIDTLRKKHGYPNIYMAEDFTTLRVDDAQKLGWYNNHQTKGRIVGYLKGSLRFGLLTIRSDVTWREFRTFSKKPNGSMEAQSGMNDDCVVALGIAHFVAASTPIERVPWRHLQKLKAKQGPLAQAVARELDRRNTHPTLGRFRR